MNLYVMHRQHTQQEWPSLYDRQVAAEAKLRAAPLLVPASCVVCVFIHVSVAGGKKKQPQEQPHKLDSLHPNAQGSGGSGPDMQNQRVWDMTHCVKVSLTFATQM